MKPPGTIETSAEGPRRGGRLPVSPTPPKGRFVAQALLIFGNFRALPQLAEPVPGDLKLIAEAKKKDAECASRATIHRLAGYVPKQCTRN